jgi:hypothetical protein
MGEVLEVIDVALDRARALKIIYAHVVDRAGARARFDLEARIGSRVDSPYLVDVIDTGVDPESGRMYLVMELLVGDNLGQRLDRLGPRPAAEVVHQLGQLARALARMHARGVVHRDLKPNNLFWHERAGEPPRLKVLDLGIAKLIGPDAGGTTSVAGTPAYMSPEQLRGHGVGTATDIYALGLIAFTLLVGRGYWTEADTLDPIGFALVAVQGTRVAASVRARVANIELPAGFDAWFARVTARARSRRFPSAIAAVRALAVALELDVPAELIDALDEPSAIMPGDASDGDDGDLPDVSSVAEPAGGTEAATDEPLRGAGNALAHATTAVPIREARPRRWLALGVVLVALCGTATAWSLAKPAQAYVASPLAGSDAVLACPILETEGAASQDGWLGAATAAIVCERARVLLGGLPARTRVPAELLGLAAVQDPDADPYAVAEARAQTLAAAQARGQAYVDGRVEHVGAGFRVRLVLRRPDGAVLHDATGEAAALPAAVRSAMQPLVDAGAIPTMAPDPTVADYSRAADLPTLLRLVDLNLAFINNAGGLDDECAWLASVSTDLAPFLRYVCKYQLGYPLPSVAPPPATTPGGLTAWARVEHMMGTDHPAAIDALKQQYSRAPSAWARSTIAATLSCLLSASAPRDALAWAWNAVEDEPKNPTGEWCSSWGQLMAVANDTSSQERAAARWQAWAPSESYSWWYSARTARSDERALVFAQRAYALSPFDTNIAADLADRLLRRGRSADAGQIARRLATSRHPVHRRTSDLLMARFDASEGRFGPALDTARRAMHLQPGDAGWTRSQRLAIAWQAVAIANVLGRAHEVADEAVAELVGPERLGFDGSAEDERRQIAAICAYASRAIAERCFARLRAASDLRGGSTDEIRAFTEGARRFANGDAAGAAEAWRPLVRDAHAGVAMLAEAMVTAFAAAGDPDLAIQIEVRTESDAPLLNRATLTMARAAQVAQARGQHALAARLAKRVVDAWQDADTLPPILAELKPLAR